MRAWFYIIELRLLLFCLFPVFFKFIKLLFVIRQIFRPGCYRQFQSAHCLLILTVNEIAFTEGIKYVRFRGQICGTLRKFQRFIRPIQLFILSCGIEPGKVIQYLRVV